MEASRSLTPGSRSGKSRSSSTSSGASDAPSLAATDDSNGPIFTTFRFGASTISATGGYADAIHDNVLKLEVCRSGLHEFLYRAVVSRLPAAIRNLFARFLPPLWVLPNTIILKTQKPCWDDEFENEKRMYHRLRQLQGSMIPICYGEAIHRGLRALVLSDVGGEWLGGESSLSLDYDDICVKLDRPFRAITHLGVGYDDLKLSNFHLVGDRVFILDLESAWELKSSTMSPERAFVYAADQLLSYWDSSKSTWEDDKAKGNLSIPTYPRLNLGDPPLRLRDNRSDPFGQAMLRK